VCTYGGLEVEVNCDEREVFEVVWDAKSDSNLLEIPLSGRGVLGLPYINGEWVMNRC
jgi:hypothetical protein